MAADAALSALRPAAEIGSASRPTSSRTTGTRQALLLFARFRNEGSTTVPSWAAQVFDPSLPGSFSHYWDTVSFGQLRVRGVVAPQVYLSKYDVTGYLGDDSTGVGRLGRFSREVLERADPDMDFAAFDNDGPDGVPDSGDDDGFVDALFIVIASAPKDFLQGAATGIANLGLGAQAAGDSATAGLATTDRGASGQPIRVGSDRGAILQGRTLAQAVGSMCHEYGHVLGLPDLYDTAYLRTPGAAPEQDSGGVGRWCLMGRGALGWHGDDGPTSLCAWSRLQLGWAVAQRPTQEQADIALQGVGRQGSVLEVPMGRGESFLVEYRRRSTSWFDRHLPAEGLLVWHVTGGASRAVDLECADGRWSDAGYRTGTQAAPADGGDNLDFWAHDPAYAAAHAGNLGDATDPFDGVRFTAFAPEGNPAALGADGQGQIRLEGIRLDGDVAHARLTVAPARLVLEALWPAAPHVVAGASLSLPFALRNNGALPATGLAAGVVYESNRVLADRVETELRDVEGGGYLMASDLYADASLRVRLDPGWGPSARRGCRCRCGRRGRWWRRTP
ncbi:MAG: immune inhibitor A domain-containing protein [Candidatus Latescibacterota bacterium]